MEQQQGGKRKKMRVISDDEELDSPSSLKKETKSPSVSNANTSSISTPLSLKKRIIVSAEQSVPLSILPSSSSFSSPIVTPSNSSSSFSSPPSLELSSNVLPQNNTLLKKEIKVESIDKITPISKKLDKTEAKKKKEKKEERGSIKKSRPPVKKNQKESKKGKHEEQKLTKKENTIIKREETNRKPIIQKNLESNQRKSRSKYRALSSSSSSSSSSPPPYIQRKRFLPKRKSRSRSTSSSESSRTLSSSSSSSSPSPVRKIQRPKAPSKSAPPPNAKKTTITFITSDKPFPKSNRIEYNSDDEQNSAKEGDDLMDSVREDETDPNLTWVGKWRLESSDEMLPLNSYDFLQSSDSGSESDSSNSSSSESSSYSSSLSESDSDSSISSSSSSSSSQSENFAEDAIKNKRGLKSLVKEERPNTNESIKKKIKPIGRIIPITKSNLSSKNMKRENEKSTRPKPKLSRKPARPKLSIQEEAEKFLSLKGWNQPGRSRRTIASMQAGLTDTDQMVVKAIPFTQKDDEERNHKIEMQLLLKREVEREKKFKETIIFMREREAKLDEMRLRGEYVERKPYLDPDLKTNFTLLASRRLLLSAIRSKAEKDALLKHQKQLIQDQETDEKIAFFPAEQPQLICA
eukprot:TRINITY_DN2022_c2_g1_i1.p1 TRINITY_DN2022_c2_g1~~TRINITY_DN2022_c2_g1_i1.p1  ORF type:complete len:633 (+),score=189.46 TRINITY_DN2022_c2_g1_i1:134-2032(+)